MPISHGFRGLSRSSECRRGAEGAPSRGALGARRMQAWVTWEATAAQAAAAQAAAVQAAAVQAAAAGLVGTAH